MASTKVSKAAVDPFNLPFPLKLTAPEREWFVLFAIAVAGKSAKQTEAKLNDYLGTFVKYFEQPFAAVQSDINMMTLRYWLKVYHFGQYDRIEKAWTEAVKLNVMEDLTVEKLEAIPGIGPKTARFIVLYTDPNADVVPLDTHILKYLAANFPHIKVPKSTPPAGKKYHDLEALFKTAAAVKGKTVRELDTEVWKSYAKTYTDNAQKQSEHAA